MADPRPGDPADRAMDVKADGAFGGLTNHRGGYGDDKLARLTDWLRAHPTATLASGEGALLLAEIDRLRARCREIDDEAYDYAEQIEQLKAEIDRLRAAAKDSADHYADARAEIDRLTRILAALREPSQGVVDAMMNWLVWTDGPYVKNAVRAAVAAAEQEVSRE